MTEVASIGVVVLALGQILQLALAWRRFSGASEAREIKPNPLIVDSAPSYMTKTACEQMHAQIEKFEVSKFLAIDQRLADLTAALEARNERGEERAALIHQRINTVSELLREEKGKLEQHIRNGGHNGERP